MKFSTRREFISDLAYLPVAFNEELHIDADEAAQWVSLEQGEATPFAANLFGGSSHYAKYAPKLNRLIERVMGNASMDDMADLRDTLRAMVIDQVRDEVVASGIAFMSQRARIAQQEREDDAMEDRAYWARASA